MAQHDNSADDAPDADRLPPARTGTVALIGRSNVGKSTLLNAALELPLAIVSRKPQTTRDQLLAVVRHGGAEIGLLDTPGLHRADTRLGKEMNRAARMAARAADVVVFVGALPPNIKKVKGELTPHPGDLQLLDEVMSADRPVVLAINKIDLLKNKSKLLALIASYTDGRSFAAVVPISARNEDGIKRVLDEVAKLLPEGEHHHDEDTITNRPLRFFAREYVREPILRATSEEIPHAVAVTIDRFEEPSGAGVVHIDATIHVERAGQKRIMIGKGGEMLKRVGIQARERIEELVEQQVNLKLWVRVTPHWRNAPEQLADFGLLAKRGD